MIRFADIVNRYGKKQLLIATVCLLLGVNVIKLGYGFYTSQQEELAQNLDLLAKYQKSTAKIENLRRRVQLLEQQSKQMESYLFTGSSEEEIASAMQILLQDYVVKSGLEPESLRPTTSGKMDRGQKQGEISVKMRLAGTSQNFIEFLSSLYRSKHLFKIESFTLKPYKKTELKIFLDLNGYYKIADKQEKQQ